jgi:hypothetical protein
MSALPVPTSADGRGLDSWLTEHLNLHGHDDSEEAVTEGLRRARSAAAWCVSAMRPSAPYWHLQIVGEQGSAKTTAARLLKRVTDPSSIEDMPPPKTPHDLAVVAKGQRVTSLDNLSEMGPAMSDALARMATGATVANRGLYTDDDIAAFRVEGAALLNGIPDVINKPDLAERTLSLVLQRPLRRKLDAEVSAAFQADQPKVLASLLDGLVGVMAYGDDVIVELDRERAPRMVDPFVWAEAAGRVWDWKPWQLLDDLELTERDAAEAMMESSPLARALTAMVAKYLRRHPKETQWKGQCGELLDACTDEAMAMGLDTTEYWPKSAKGMTNALRRIAQPLRIIGWEVEHRWDGRGNDRAPRWTLRPPKDGECH